MRAALLLASHQIRSSWRSWLVLVMLLGIAGGAVLTAAAGARRTQSAYPRFLAWSGASDVLVAPFGRGLESYDNAVARLPQVAAIAPVVGLNLQPVGTDGHLLNGPLVLAPLDRRYGSVVDRPRILAGRLPRATRPDEIAVDQAGARTLRLRVGSRIILEAMPNLGPGEGGTSAARVRRIGVRVVGIIVTRTSVDPVTDQDKAPRILASTALWRQLGPDYEAFDGAEVRLRPGASAAGFGAAAQALARRVAGTQGQVYIADETTQAATIERSIEPESVALALFALVLACTALLVIGQAVTRVLVGASSDYRVMSALGMTRSQLLAAELIAVAAAGAVGAVLAAGLAVAASPLMPIGVARLAEPAPGVSVDAVVLAAGAPAIVVLLVARAAWPAWQLCAVRGGESRLAPRQSRLVEGLAALGAPVTVTTGVRLALEPGRGRTATPVRGALAGTLLSVLAVTAALGFGASLLHLVRAPRLYGQTWDAALDLQFQGITAARTERLIGGDPRVAGWSFGDHGIISIGHLVVPAIAVTPGRGPLMSPTLLQGRVPRTSNEIVLGTTTLAQAGRRVGQSVVITSGERRHRYVIVGRAVFPAFGQGSFTPTDLGQGAQTTVAALQGELKSQGVGPGFEFVLIRFTRGTSEATDIAGLRRSVARFCSHVQQSTCLVIDQHPDEIANYARVDAAPDVLAALLAGIGLAVLAQLIVISGRRRRRDFAVLRTLGLLRYQVSSITAWQVSTLATLALLGGLPLGVAAGHRSWALFSDALGVPVSAITPVQLVLASVPVTLVLANAVALWPGIRTARMRVIDVLRAE